MEGEAYASCEAESLLLLLARGGVRLVLPGLEWRSCRRVRVATVTVMRVCRRGPMWSTTVPIRIRIVRPTAAATGVVIVGRIGGRAVGIVRRLVMLLVVLIIRRRPVIGHELNELRSCRRAAVCPSSPRGGSPGRSPRPAEEARCTTVVASLAQGLFGHRRRLAWALAARPAGLCRSLHLVRAEPSLGKPMSSLAWRIAVFIGSASSSASCALTYESASADGIDAICVTDDEMQKIAMELDTSARSATTHKSQGPPQRASVLVLVKLVNPSHSPSDHSPPITLTHYL